MKAEKFWADLSPSKVATAHLPDRFWGINASIVGYPEMGNLDMPGIDFVNSRRVWDSISTML